MDLSKCRSLLASGDAGERLMAAERLCLAGPEACVAAVELVRACGDDEPVASQVVSALEEMGPPPASCGNDLMALVDDGNATVGYWAATLLGRLKDDGKVFQDDLAELLSAVTDLAVRQRIAWAMGEIGADSPTAIEALSLAAKTGDDRLKRIATKAIAGVS